MKRGVWTREEDAKMVSYVSKHGVGNWSDVPKKAGLKRCGKSCRLRWTNYLRPDLNHANFTTQEEEMIIRLHAAIGSRWSIIAQQLPGRSDNDVKNYWNTRLRKKLSEMGIDPVTHKPFSQIIEDYGNIGGFGRFGTRVGPLNLKHSSFAPKTGEYPAPPEADPGLFQDSLFNNRTSDILGPIQAMKLMSEAAQCNSTTPFDFPNGHSSTTTSSSSTCSAEGQETSSLTCSWRDYLVNDEFLPTDYNHLPQEQELSNFNMGQVQQSTPPLVQGKHDATVIASSSGMEWMNFSGPDNGFQGGSSSSNSSFIDAILDEDNNESFLCFPNLLEEPFNY